jgi:hypothetical protein
MWMPTQELRFCFFEWSLKVVSSSSNLELCNFSFLFLSFYVCHDGMDLSHIKDDG